MKRFKAVVVAVVAAAGMSVTVTPAQAADVCSTGGGGRYICDYGVTQHALPKGEKEQFVIGADYAVWTRWTKDERWTGWVSLGMPDPAGSARATSRVTVTDQPGTSQTAITLRNSNGALVGRTRSVPGASWTPWDFPNCC
ncbi:hypothetical protein ACQEVS_00145 [Streptomyces sp. CA-181903]|uniref:hypothetical protein n=1 Tax=Streptomyces sp. CA-181903 TaxID=3240055 RepID=UPI003D8AFA40